MAITNCYFRGTVLFLDNLILLFKIKDILTAETLKSISKCENLLSFHWINCIKTVIINLDKYYMCLLFLIGETTKNCRRIKEKMTIFKIEGKTTKYCRKIKEKMKMFKIEGKTTKYCRRIKEKV